MFTKGSAEAKAISVAAPLQCGRPMFALQNALAAVKAGTADAYIACVGDSETVGFLAGDGSSYAGAYANSYPLALASKLATFGYSVNTDAVLGDRNLHLNGVANYNVYDPRLSTPGGWALGGTSTTALGGNALQNTSNITDSLTYTPTYAYNALDIFYNTTVGNSGTANVLVGGTIVGSFNCHTGAQSVQKLTISGLALSTNTITITPTAQSVFVTAIVPRNTAQKQVYIHVIAAAGAQANSMTNIYGLTNFLAAAQYPYAAALMCFGTNEALASTSASTFASNLSTEALQLQFASYVTGSSAPPGAIAFGCDIVLMTGPPLDPVADSGPAGQLDTLYMAMANVCPARFNFLDVRFAAGGSYSSAVASGYMTNTNAAHWIQGGYAFWANILTNLLMSAVGVAQKYVS